MPSARLAGQRDQLAAFVLDLDQAVGEGRMIVDPGVGRQPQAPGAERASAPRRRIASSIALAAGPRDIDPQVERRALEQRRPFVGVDQRSTSAGSSHAGAATPARPARRPRSAPGRAAIRRTGRASSASSSARPSIAARPLAGRSPAAADGAEHQLAHRPAVLRAGIAPGLEIARDDRRRRAARRRGPRRSPRRGSRSPPGRAPRGSWPTASDNWAPRG